MRVNLSATCFYIKDNQVKEGTFNDFTRFIDKTTRPDGIGYKWDVREEVGDDGIEWAVTFWGSGGNKETVARIFATEQEARDFLEGIYVRNILNDGTIFICLDRDKAEEVLRELIED